MNNNIVILFLASYILIVAIGSYNPPSELDDNHQHHRSDRKWWMNTAVNYKERLLKHWLKNNRPHHHSKDEDDLIKLAELKKANRTKDGNTATIEGSIIWMSNDDPSSSKQEQRQVTNGSCSCLSTASFSCDQTNLLTSTTISSTIFSLTSDFANGYY